MVAEGAPPLMGAVTQEPIAFAMLCVIISLGLVIAIANTEP